MSGLGSDTNILLRRVAEECDVNIDKIKDVAVLADLRVQAEAYMDARREKGDKDAAMNRLREMLSIIDA